MPSASEQLFAEIGLDAFGHPPDYMPPKPPSPRKIAMLGDKLDRLERLRDHMWDEDRYRRWFSARYNAIEKSELSDEDIEALEPHAYSREVQHRLYIARMEYGQVLTARNDYLTRKAQLSKQRVKSQDKRPLWDAMFKAEQHLDLIVAAGSGFSTQREFIDAHAAHCLASTLHDIAEKKFDIQEREARADKRAGIVRHRASRIRRN